MLKSKSILADKSVEDGIRISVMSRHTLNDGKTPDPRLTEDLYDVHMPELAAPPRFVGAYYRGELSFDEYAKHYLNYLETTQRENIIALIQQSLVQNITVMCIEDDPEHCHRKILLEHSSKVAPELRMNLEIEIN